MNVEKMKFFNLKSVFALFMLTVTLFTFSSCKKEEKKDPYKVKFTVNANGKFKNGNPKIAYTNASGATITEELTINKEWTKEVSGASSFPIKANITGTIDSAEVMLETKAYKDGVLVDLGSSSQSSDLETPLNINYNSTFE